MPLSEEIAVRVRHLLDGPGDIDEASLILVELVREGTDESLSTVLELVHCDYRGNPFSKWDIKTCAAYSAIAWAQMGLDRLVEVSERHLYSTIRCVTEALMGAALGHVPLHADTVLDRSPLGEILVQKVRSPDIQEMSRKSLFRFVQNLDPEESIPNGLTNSFLAGGVNVGETTAERHRGRNSYNDLLLEALMSRWFKLSDASLKGLERLIGAPGIPEEDLHRYLAAHPSLLDPFYAELWSKPRLGEDLVVDFLVKQVDGEHVVVELEKATDEIFTKGGNLTAKATHAIRQALEYREWLISNRLYALQRFPDLKRVSALVVIGMESELSPVSKNRLRQENESRAGISLRIMGFDALLNRAQTVRDNLARP